jgi:SAM-dependent methyltransferase
VTTARATSFGAIADSYDRLRPDPAPEAVEWLLPARRELLVDLAAGTGKLTRAIAAAAPAARVVAVEPDGRMAAVLRASSPAILVVAGVGEAIPLRANCADGLFISSAWHWMDPERAVPEIARVLRDGGRFGLIWTSRDREVDWVRELDWLREPDRNPDRQYGEAARRRNREISLPDGHPLVNLEWATFTYTRRMSVDDLVESIGTYSRVIIATEEERAIALGRVRATIEERFPGATEVDVPIRSLCWRADRAPR